MKKAIYFTSICFLMLFSFVIGDTYATQEKQIFKAKTLSQDFVFNYKEPFEEVFLKTDSDAVINGLHFKRKSPKGVVLYFHGRGWNLGAKKRSGLPEDFLARGYDVFVIDYRGFGKSIGPASEKALHHDAECAYKYLKERYPEKRISLYGMSFGTGIATKLAAKHNPRQLILESPYYSMLDMAERTASYLPSFVTSWILKYHLRSDQFIEDVTCPIHIFHGTQDKLIPHISSSRLIKKVKAGVRARLISIEKGDHDHLPSYREYSSALDKLLN